MPILLGIAVGFAAFVWLDRLNPPYAVTDDGVRDQLLARDCTDLDRCHLMGAATSLAGFQQGAVWLDLLIAVRMLGGVRRGQRTVVLALLASSVATLFVVVWRWLRPSLALPAALLLLAEVSFDVSPNLLVNSSSAPFPDVLMRRRAALLRALGPLRFMVAASFALGSRRSTSTSRRSFSSLRWSRSRCWRAPRPWRALLTSTAVLLATYFFTSSAALRANLVGLAQHGRLVPALAAGLVLLLVCALLGSPLSALVVGGACLARRRTPHSALRARVALARLCAAAPLRRDLPPSGSGAGGDVRRGFDLRTFRDRRAAWSAFAGSRAPRRLRAFAFVATHPDADATPRPGAGERLEPGRRERRQRRRRAARLELRGSGLSHSGRLVPRAADRHVRRGAAARVGRRPRPTPAPGASRWRGRPLRRRARRTPSRSGRTTVAVTREIESWLQPDRLARLSRSASARHFPPYALPRHRGRRRHRPRSFPVRLAVVPGESQSRSCRRRTWRRTRSRSRPIAGESRELSLSDPGRPQCVWQFTRVEGVRRPRRAAVAPRAPPFR